MVMSCPIKCPKWSNIALTGAVEDFSMFWSTDVLENAFITIVYSMSKKYFLSDFYCLTLLAIDLPDSPGTRKSAVH